MQANISTLAELLDTAGTQWRVYDMGRRISKIDKQTFTQFESTQIPYPYPLQQHALLAIQFWNKNATAEPYLWFLKFPLDEQSKLIQASRNHFASMVLEALGTELTGEGENQKTLDNNPYIFTPNANKRAALNALLKVELNKPASIYYEQAEIFFSGQQHYQDWQNVALQGLADFAFRLDKQNNEQRLIEALPHLTESVLSPLAAMLEHVPLSVSLTENLLGFTQKEMALDSSTQLINYLRILSHSQALGLILPMIDSILESKHANDLNLQLVLAGRYWHCFEPKNNGQERLAKFMEQVADQEQAIFNSIFADLVAIPELRLPMLALLRQTNRSERLSRALGGLFSN